MTTWGLFKFYVNFRSVFSTSVKNAFRILIEIALNLEMVFSSIHILILILPVHEHGIPSHFHVQIFHLLS